MKRLSYNTLDAINYSGYILKAAPERILQFGEGNFLRGFVDYFFDILNEKGLFHGKCVVVQPLEQGNGERINDQEGLYTLYLRDVEQGDPVTIKRVISVISRVINPYHDRQAFLNCARNPDLRILVSNTTEAGIAFRDTDQLYDMQGTFPAKLTSFLWDRYNAFPEESGKGFIILSCELIDNNGDALKKCVLQYKELWNLPDSFSAWIDNENIFCNTLVDRIITGYPAAESELMNRENGYEDQVIDTGEPFAFWAIQGPDCLKRELPFEQAGLPVRIVADQSYYKKRKVRILNGAQTCVTLAAYLAGIDLEREYMDDPLFYKYIQRTIFDEIIPATDLDLSDMQAFAKQCLLRLSNPFIDHKLLDISLNSVAKWKARVFPTIQDYYIRNRSLPKLLSFSLASLLAFYRCEEEEGRFYGMRNGEKYEVRDSIDILRFFSQKSQLPNTEYVHAYLEAYALHGTDFHALDDLEAQLVHYLNELDRYGMRTVVAKLLGS